MDYQYKVIVSNRAVYKEFEIPTDMEGVRLGTTSSCEFRLNPDSFLEISKLNLQNRKICGIWIALIMYISAEEICENYSRQK